MRYPRPEFLNAIANNTPLPMIIDAGCRMLLDLGKWESYGGKVGVNSDPTNLPKVDPKGAFLLSNITAGPSGATSSNSNIFTDRGSTNATPQALRLTKHVMVAPIDVSRSAQLRDIEASFPACNVLPDADIWANQDDLFRFSKRSEERGVDVDGPGLDCAILQPMKSDHDSFLPFYLTQDDECVINSKET
ncbi:hypothetical protein BD779DRAFT_1787063 [Infundibulicybe gibba]|nr:hypothetical protein BD779DRAFT_1787063 [Infundibulicybe gibba]